MAWTVPKTHVAGELTTAAIFNTHVRDNQIVLRAAGLSISGQTAQDFIYASSATQFARLAPQTNKIPRYNGVTNSWEMASPLEFAWPVGSIFRANVSTNPGTLIGVGTWAAIGAGRVAVSLDSGDTDFDTVRETGGEKTVALTIATMPSHTHVQDAHNHTQNAHDHTVTNCDNTVEIGGFPSTSSLDNSGTKATNTTTAVNNNATATNQNAGSGTAHNNLQPYIVCYVWERTA